MARPLTTAERARVEKARGRVCTAREAGRAGLRDAIAARDRLLADLVAAGCSQTEIAEMLGVTRQSVRLAVRRAEES